MKSPFSARELFTKSSWKNLICQEELYSYFGIIAEEDMEPGSRHVCTGYVGNEPMIRTLSIYFNLDGSHSSTTFSTTLYGFSLWSMISSTIFSILLFFVRRSRMIRKSSW
jgi:hypothetical protein